MATDTNTDTDDEESIEEDDSLTTNTKARNPHTGTVSALLLVGTACAVVLTYVYRGVEVPLWATATFGLATLTSIAWVFGESALRAARDAKGGRR